MAYFSMKIHTTYVVSIFERLRKAWEILNPILQEIGYEISYPELGDYWLTFYHNDAYEVCLSPEDKGILSVEFHDLRYPPDQGYCPPGGYTITSFIWGDNINWLEPDAAEKFKEMVLNPAEYLGIDRDCYFGDRNSPDHNDPGFVQECYHD